MFRQQLRLSGASEQLLPETYRSEIVRSTAPEHGEI
jgi:hypothetical protein